ncbi:MAG TPA: hypothetical protein VIS06_01955, partial [Mycobacteriales bacterium]
DLSGLPERSAAATVRVAALIDSPHSLDLLAGYATDPRARVQQELIEVWKYFDPDTYARHVLADAPLHDGRLTITDRRLVPALHHLRHLMELSLDVTAETVTTLDWLANAPSLTTLWLRALNAMDLSPLRTHAALRFLWMRLPDLGPYLDTLPLLAGLEELHLWPDTPISGLDFVARLSRLEQLGLGNLSGVRDFTPISTLRGLTSLTVGECVLPVSALGPLHRLTQLTFADAFAEGGLAALTEVRPELTRLAAWRCDQVDDLSPLARLTRLRELDLRLCAHVNSLEPLRNLANLAEIDLSGARPGLDVSPLAGKRLTLVLDQGQQVDGLDQLGSGVKVKRQKTFTISEGT